MNLQPREQSPRRRLADFPALIGALMLGAMTAANVVTHYSPSSTLIYVAGAALLGAPIQRGAEAFFTAMAQPRTRDEGQPPSTGASK